jgi:hypothetical protein
LKSLIHVSNLRLRAQLIRELGRETGSAGGAAGAGCVGIDGGVDRGTCAHRASSWTAFAVSVGLSPLPCAVDHRKRSRFPCTVHGRERDSEARISGHRFTGR